MKRLTMFILVSFMAISIPLAYFIIRAHQSLVKEEKAELRYFADALFYEMEQELEDFIQKEEKRDIDEYLGTSDLSNIPEKRYILGYFQNNPDGSFQTPLGKKRADVQEKGDKDLKDTSQLNEVIGRLEEDNRLFNEKRSDVSEVFESKPPEKIIQKKKEEQSFAGRYLDLSQLKEQKIHLGQSEKRVESIPAGQALNFQGLEQKSILQKDIKQIEVDPMQAVFINEEKVILFRRIVSGNQVFRQGFVILIKQFADELIKSRFSNQPMAEFTRLTLSVFNHGEERTIAEAGAKVKDKAFLINRTFPRPFAFLNAELTCDNMPESAGRNTLNIMTAVIILVICIGFFAIYRSAKAIVDMSERRSQFVSSVTHELKTPLTNIRMYIEMLEQGIASSPEREKDYLKILGSESSRLSRLINNVLEFSKLEKKKRPIELCTGSFEEVIEEVKGVMSEKLRQEGFSFNIEKAGNVSFMYESEAMVQVLINLIDNSIKFGKNEPIKEITLSLKPQGDWMKISLSDTGPGIPRYALKKVFDDFFRVENELTRNTRGTGIGLALVNKYIRSMGGSVSAKNNAGPGCAITILLPIKNPI